MVRWAGSGPAAAFRPASRSPSRSPLIDLAGSQLAIAISAYSSYAGRFDATVDCVHKAAYFSFLFQCYSRPGDPRPLDPKAQQMFAGQAQQQGGSVVLQGAVREPGFELR